MKVGDLVSLDASITTDDTVGILVQKDAPSKRRLRLAVVLWPDGVQEDVYESWLEVINESR